jgi:CheY-like chemotaxis protein
LTITVRDTGAGIDPAFLPFVFAPFRQADATYTRAQPALGLGLAIAKHLVELHGGTIAAESAGVGHGATFRVDLPVRRAESAPVNRHQPDIGSETDGPRGPLPDLSGCLVLVVDDEADARELAAELLETCGARVIAAASAAEARRLLAGHTPHVMIVDLAMPDEDGCTLYEQLCKSGTTIPAVALTAHARPIDLERSRRAGFVFHLRKPADLIEIANVVRSLVSDSTGARG